MRNSFITSLTESRSDGSNRVFSVMCVLLGFTAFTELRELMGVGRGDLNDNGTHTY